ncbi:TilS substrate-binding domain-containing protein, partial [Streptomyces sp. SAS_269]
MARAAEGGQVEAGGDQQGGHPGPAHGEQPQPQPAAHRVSSPVRPHRRTLRTASMISSGDIEEVDRLITGWRGQGVINLPGKVVARRQGGRL